jgi:hypothetical protein
MAAFVSMRLDEAGDNAHLLGNPILSAQFRTGNRYTNGIAF